MMRLKVRDHKIIYFIEQGISMRAAKAQPPGVSEMLVVDNGMSER